MPAAEIARVRAEIDALYRKDSRKIFATLIRLLGDFDRAEEALSDAVLQVDGGIEDSGKKISRLPDQPEDALLESLDALSRTQLRTPVRRCRDERRKNNLP